MPDRPGVDDNDKLVELIQLWQASQRHLDRRYAEVTERVRAELRAPNPNSNTVLRLRNQAQRLTDLGTVTDDILSDLTEGTQRFLSEGTFADIYAAGARASGIPFSFTAPHRAAIEVLARDTYDDVLVATRHVIVDSKEFIRDVSRRLTGLQLTSGEGLQSQIRDLRNQLRGHFGRRGIGSITYADGSRHGFGEYAEMLLRTKSAMAYNQGTLNQARLAGAQFIEILDGALCGLTSHHDTQLANGLIVPFQVAQAWPIAHPNCRRAMLPRFDVTADTLGTAPSLQSAAARADQAAFEAALRRQTARRGARRQPRQRRQPRPRRQARARTTPTPRRPRPQGEPMAAQMTYHTPAARKNLQPGVDAVSALHGSRSDRLLPRVTWATGGKSKGGHFTPAAKPPKPRRPPRGASDDARTRYAQRVDEWAAAPVQPEIRVISRKDAPPGAYNVSLWHEMGHWQDFDPSTGNYVSRIAEGVTQGRQFAPDHLADEVTAMRRFLDAAYDTDAVHRVATRYGRQFGNYAASPHELWARAYSQWVAENVTDDALRDAGNSGVDYLRSITPGYQWERHEFATLGPLVEAVLRARGVRT